jgi:hypothetical protein
MKKLLLSAAVLLFAASTASASVNVVVKDTAVYASTALYTFENLWIQSRFSPFSNYPADGYGLSTASCRGMAGKDGKILICRREAAGTLLEKYMNKSNILVYDANTGNLDKTIPVPDSLFHQKDAVGDTLRAIGYPSNDIQVDAAGNVILMSMTINLGTSPFVVAALKVDLTAGTVLEAKRILKKNYPETTSGTNAVRFDAFNVYGNMFGNGYIMAPVAGVVAGLGDMVLRWNVVNGVANENFIPIQIKKFVPSKTAKFNDTAPRVKPISETLFYLDGQQSYATLYDMDGNVVDSIRTALYPASPGNNGVDEFSIGTHNFVVYSHANTATLPYSSWGIAELGTGMSLVNMERLYIFPKGGLGNTSNPVRTAVTYIDVVGNSAFIYVYGFANGLAAYKLTLKPTAVNSPNTSKVEINVVNNRIQLSESVAKLEVFNTTGQKFASAKNVAALGAKLGKGIYLVAITDNNGDSKVQKVVVN